ncbi:MAG: PepSY-associated TM helix domain-containing protein [Marinifilaceae bacterium]
MRKFFFKLHLWLSIPFGIVIAVVCLTGAILVFETELLEVCYPSRYFVKEVKAEPLSPATLLSEARQQLPDSIEITGLRVSMNPKRTYQIVLPGKKATAFIDPYTAVITGVDNGQGFFMQTMRLHRWLLDSYKRDGSFSLGKAIVGYSTLVMVAILISGLVIWYPRNRKSLVNRLKINTKMGWHRFFYDLHISGGFYATLLLLVLALTGLTWSFGWYRDAFYSAFGVETTQTQTHAHTNSASADKLRDKQGGQQARERKGNGHSHTQDRERSNAYVQWETVLTELKNRYPNYNSITIQDGSASVSTANYGNTRGSDRYTFNPHNGTITEIQLYKDQPSSGKIRGWIYSVHVGTWGGVTTRILSFAVSLLGAVFAITGYYFWIRKKVRKKR